MAFIDIFLAGPFWILALIAGILFAIQTVMIFLLWRRGETSYFLKMISYAIASVGLIVCSVLTMILASGGGGKELVTIDFIIAGIFAPLAAGLSIADYIWQKWLKKEGKA